MDFPDLLVARHGQTSWNAVHRFQGMYETELTKLGEAQAREIGARISRFGADSWDWVTSPMQRTCETARLARLALGQDGLGPMRTDARLLEIGMGQLAGLTHDEASERWPHLFSGKLSHYRALGRDEVGGESLEELARRCGEFLSALTAPSIVITHGITSRVLRCLACGRSPKDFAEIEGEQGQVYHLRASIGPTRHEILP
jgi:probable phosphoglycerate mutase